MGAPLRRNNGMHARVLILFYNPVFKARGCMVAICCLLFYHLMKALKGCWEWKGMAFRCSNLKSSAQKMRIFMSIEKCNVVLNLAKTPRIILHILFIMHFSSMMLGNHWGVAPFVHTLVIVFWAAFLTVICFQMSHHISFHNKFIHALLFLS